MVIPKISPVPGCARPCPAIGGGIQAKKSDLTCKFRRPAGRHLGPKSSSNQKYQMGLPKSHPSLSVPGRGVSETNTRAKEKYVPGCAWLCPPLVLDRYDGCEGGKTLALGWPSRSCSDPHFFGFRARPGTARLSRAQIFLCLGC